MSKIHPTAIIDPAATLGENVQIGPYVCIEGPVTIGPGCVLEAHSVVTGDVILGTDNRIGYHAVIGSWPQDRAFDPATASGVRIGDRNMIREHCTIHRGTAPGSMTRLGSDCLLMVGAHLGHNSRVGDHVVLANNVLLGGYVEINDRVFVGGGSVFHQFVQVGRGAMIQGISGFSKDILPYTLAAEVNLVYGLNVVGLRRSGVTAAERLELKAAFKLLLASGLNIAQALEAARERTWGPCATEFFEFAAAAKKRGITGYAGDQRAASAE